jgi:hypothetical protein
MPISLARPVAGRIGTRDRGSLVEFTQVGPVPAHPRWPALPARRLAARVQESCKVWGLVHFSAHTHSNGHDVLAENMDLTPLRCDFAVLLAHTDDAQTSGERRADVRRAAKSAILAATL